MDIVHLAAHAYADSLRPARSRLLLGGPSRGEALTVGEISSLPLRRGAMVVLSACSTAAGPVPNGEGTLSLARAFLAAGAGTVIASLWPVDDEETRLLMTAFHGHVVRGRTPDEALRLAGREHARAIRSAASFVVVGGLN